MRKKILLKVICLSVLTMFTMIGIAQQKANEPGYIQKIPDSLIVKTSEEYLFLIVF